MTFLTNNFMYENAQGSIKIGGDTFKVMLLKETRGADQSLVTVGDFIRAGCVEADATNYVGGFGGKGRKTISLASVKDDEHGRANVMASGLLTWIELGGVRNNSVMGAMIVKEIHNDAASPVVAFLDLKDTEANARNGKGTPTNGSDFVLEWPDNLVGMLTQVSGRADGIEI